MAISLFRIWENEWYQYDKGLFEEQEFSARSSNWAELMMRFPGYRAVWDQSSSNYSAGFTEFLNALLSQQEI